MLVSQEREEGKCSFVWPPCSLRGDWREGDRGWGEGEATGRSEPLQASQLAVASARLLPSWAAAPLPPPPSRPVSLAQVFPLSHVSSIYRCGGSIPVAHTELKAPQKVNCREEEKGVPTLQELVEFR